MLIAMKMYDKKLMANSKRTVQREVHTLLQLEHTNLLALFDVIDSPN
jgi:hypothetical protein